MKDTATDHHGTLPGDTTTLSKGLDGEDDEEPILDNNVTRNGGSAVDMDLQGEESLVPNKATPEHTNPMTFRAIGRVKDGSTVLDTAGCEPSSLAEYETDDDGSDRADKDRTVDEAIRLLESRGRGWMLWRRHDTREPAAGTIEVEH